MSAVPLAIATALVALRCQLISDDPYVLGSVSRVLPATRPAFLRALNGTRRLIGCPEVGDPEEPPGAFSGGQCPGSRYTGTWVASYTTSDVNGLNLQTQNLSTTFGQCNFAPFATGPIGSFRTDVSGQTVQGRIVRPDGTIAWNAYSTNLPNNRRFVSATGSITSVAPCPGQPDNCGGPPPIYPPPSNFTTNIDITYNIDDGTEVTVNIPIIFAPITANFDGSLRIPIEFNLGGIDFTGDVNLPDFTVTVDPLLPPGSGDDLTEQGEDDEDEETEPKKPGDKIVGVVVTTTNTESSAVSSYALANNTPVFLPRLGSVKFIYSIGGLTFRSSDIDIKDRRTFIPCPFSQGADAVVASPAKGVVFRFTPIKGLPLATKPVPPPP